jgi:electron transfer flavoprotein beta subunit
MRVVVCVKQVPNTTDIKIDPETNTLVREGVESILNPFDAYAVEEAIRTKDKLGCETVALTMGPPQAEAVLREAISHGIDSGVLVCDRAFAGGDTWATSYTLAMALKKIGDLGVIFCGKQASDGDTAQVGPGIATHLDLPQITYVRKIHEIDDKHIVAERMLENGSEIIECSVPCIVTVVKELNDPRLPSLKGKMAAKRAEIPRWAPADLGCVAENIGLDGSPTKVVKVFSPPSRDAGEMITGEPHEIAQKLAAKLKDTVIGLTGA